MQAEIKTVILDTSQSPYARLQSVPIGKNNLEDGFWKRRLNINLTETIPSQFLLLEKTGRLDNFRRVAGDLQKPYQGFIYNDSDVYKWLEAASWSLEYGQSDTLYAMIDLVINMIINAQDKDGYLNTYFSLDKIRQRWSNLSEKHELYCAGHLIQAAIAHYRVTGKHRLLNVALRLADHIYTTFGPSQVEGTSGHPEIEMALIELYRTTAEEKYLKQAELFIDRRGHGLLSGNEYLLDHIPFRKMEILAGHAVRALYLCSGATDLTLETGESDLVGTLGRLWTTMVSQQMYVTGGIGARHAGEAMGAPYELPNARAYAETCAAIASVMWNWRMLQLKADAQYADLLEWTFYNAVLPGISLNGREYFYSNPLRDNGSHIRQTWFDCACCPPNISRTIAMFPGYMCSLSNEGVWIHLYTSAQTEFTLPSGDVIVMQQTTSYPWDGHIAFTVNQISSSKRQEKVDGNKASFSLFLRIPAWVDSKDLTFTINGKEDRQRIKSGSYHAIHRQWKVGDKIEFELPIKVRYIESHPLVTENIGRIAIARGPILYCIEEADNPGLQLSHVALDLPGQPDIEYLPELLSGIVRIHMHGQSMPIDAGWERNLYRPYIRPQRTPRKKDISIIAIPYYAWANRQHGEMEIWHRYS